MFKVIIQFSGWNSLIFNSIRLTICFSLAELEERKKHAARREELTKQLQEHRAIVKKRRNDEYQLELMFAKLSTAALEKQKAASTDVSVRSSI